MMMVALMLQILKLIKMTVLVILIVEYWIKGKVNEDWTAIAEIEYEYNMKTDSITEHMVIVTISLIKFM